MSENIPKESRTRSEEAVKEVANHLDSIPMEDRLSLAEEFINTGFGYAVSKNLHKFAVSDSLEMNDRLKIAEAMA